MGFMGRIGNIIREQREKNQAAREAQFNYDKKWGLPALKEKHNALAERNQIKDEIRKEKKAIFMERTKGLQNTIGNVKRGFDRMSVSNKIKRGKRPKNPWLD